VTNQLLDLPPAGLVRRLGAMLSDSLVVFGLLALTTLFLFVPLLSHLGKKAMVPSEVGWIWFSVYLLVIITVWFSFFGYFWTRSGQTIGMRAWRIRIEADSGELLGWRQAAKRWCCAGLPWLPGLSVLIVAQQYQSMALKNLGFALFLLGVAGLFAMCFDRHRRSWHDRVSQSRAVTLPKL
jgi:uncharacterized RDD family membrane protein YckC